VSILLVTAAVFSQVLWFGFLAWDDRHHLIENQWFHPPTWDSLVHFWTKPFFNLYIPVTYSFWLALAWLLAVFDHPLESSSGAFHLANILLHLANTALVHRLLRRRFERRTAVDVGTMLFALHPLQVEAVAWISGGRDLLSAMLALSALAIFAASLEKARAGHVRAKSMALAMASSTACFILSILAKPSTVVVPLVGLILLWSSAGGTGVGLGGADQPTGVACRGSQGGGATGRLSKPMAPMVATALAWLAAAIPIILLTRTLQVDADVDSGISMWQRPLIAADAVAFYLQKIFFPHPLMPDYSRKVSVDPADFSTYCLAAGIAASVAVAVWLRRHQIALAWLLFLAFLLPHLGFFPSSYQQISSVADRYCYLALLGVSWAVSSILNRHAPRGLMVLAAMLLVACAAKTYQYCGYWRDDRALFEYTLLHNPRSSMAHNNLGLIFAAKNDLERAFGHYAESLRLNPRNFSAANNLGIIAAERGEVDQALEYFERALALNPSSYKTIDNIGAMMAAKGRIEDAIVQHRRVVAMRPDYAVAYMNLGSAYKAKNDRMQAEAYFKRAIDLDPSYDRAHNNYAIFLQEGGRYQEAMDHFRAAIAVGQAPYLAHFNLALLFERLGRRQDAIEENERALQMAPSFSPALRLRKLLQ
jgi:tetratricopeptide (TPR) repeat protein